MTRLVASILAAAFAISCGGSSSPTAPIPTPAPAPSPAPTVPAVAVVSISATSGTSERTSTGVLYHVNFTLRETSGRSAATVTAVAVYFYLNGAADGRVNITSLTATALAANGSINYGLNINDSTGNVDNAFALSVSYTEANGRASIADTLANVAISPPGGPTFADFAGSWSGTFAGDTSGTLALAIAGSVITVTQPAPGDGILTLGDPLAGSGAFTTRAASGECTWSGPFLPGGASQSSASGLWTCGPVSAPTRRGTWKAARGAAPAPTPSPAPPPPPASNFTYANWTCNNSAQCQAVRGHPNGSAGPFCSVAACNAWNAANGVGTCTAQPVYPIYNAPAAGSCIN